MKTVQRSKDSAPKPAERREGTQKQLSAMVAERTEMLSLYCRLAGLDPLSDHRHRQPAKKLVQEFCQILIDYMAAGHFGLYDRLVNGTERRRHVADLAAQLYPRIADTTQVALDFNDKYDVNEQWEIPLSFETDLSRLGEELAVRIELEDRLIARLLA